MVIHTTRTPSSAHHGLPRGSILQSTCGTPRYMAYQSGAGVFSTALGRLHVVSGSSSPAVGCGGKGGQGTDIHDERKSKTHQKSQAHLCHY